ncbi:hypothetical protein J2X02_001453 [Pseudoxanthomonas japonensis]|jgi:hypothetical protein|uniref:hypothetical protein n=1 Tax=Pseudoxanthomonas TaxID=83618 RepID=UPI0007805555|nr:MULTISPECIES: hypothetical protein [Pseudoxanthomonas]MBA3928039.1 hypothetical protein [Xanthomonas sp.]MBL8257790.1 hypothetical protein [Pseudoxanthomonas mexicana]MDR7068636.1 hypothetical protein [Pseudoxanthomonas japonensis]
MPPIQRHDDLHHHAIDVVAVDPALLNFGIDVFQAVMNGAMPVAEYDGDDLACTGMNVIARQIGGHGLTLEEEASVVLRVVAFGDLVSQAEADSRIAAHIGVSADGYQITPAFLHAAASADIVRRVDGGFGYDLDSVAARLVH